MTVSRVSHEDPRGRSERDHGRGAYTPPTDDALPFNRGYDAHHQGYLAKNPGGYCGIGGTGVTCPVGVSVEV